MNIEWARKAQTVITVNTAFLNLISKSRFGEGMSGCKLVAIEFYVCIFQLAQKMINGSSLMNGIIYSHPRGREDSIGNRRYLLF